MGKVKDDVLNKQDLNDYITGRLRKLDTEKKIGKTQADKDSASAKEKELVALWHYVNGV